MNILNHLNLCTLDVGSPAGFFQQVFGFRIVAEHGAGNLVIMNSEDGFVLTLMHDKSLHENSYPNIFHVGFLQANRNAVLELSARIQTLGLSAPAPGMMRGNTFGFYVLAPGGVLVETSSPS
jgi:catechol-2,3-dioxygenase